MCRDGLLWIDGVARRAVQAPKPKPRITRDELGDCGWTAIKPAALGKPADAVTR